MSDLIKTVVSELFKQLEAKFASRPLILIVLHVLEAAALDVLPLVVSKTEAAHLEAPKA